MSFRSLALLVALASRRRDLIGCIPLRTPDEKAADQAATLAHLRDRLAPDTYEEVREMIVYEWEEFERRARFRFGEEGYLKIVELMIDEYPPEERVRLETIPVGDLCAPPHPRGSSSH